MTSKAKSMLLLQHLLLGASVIALGAVYLLPLYDRASVGPVILGSYWGSWRDYLSTQRSDQKNAPQRYRYDLDTDFCNVKRVVITSESDFIRRVLNGYEPKITVFGNTSANVHNLEFRQRTELNSLLKSHGTVPVKLSSSNSYSHDRKETLLREYLTTILEDTEGLQERRSNETYYFFGDNFRQEWLDLMGHYLPPPFRISKTGASSFGIGGRGSGVSFHFHGPGFSEVLHGRKRWFLYPPNQEPPGFDPDELQLHWLNRVYGNLGPLQRPLECTIRPGEVLWFPSQWHHATLNLDPYTVFVSLFVEQPAISS